MRYRRLGGSGVKVSEVALGSWITIGYNVDRTATRDIVRRGFEAGINFFDTADVYSGGQAEALLGRALADFGRKDYFVASKCFFPTGDGPNDRGLSRKHILESCDASLERLGLEALDLYQCHRFDAETPVEETLRAMDHLVRQGKILYYGFSEWSGSQIEDACEKARRLGLYPPTSNQPVYNILERRVESEVFPTCARHGIGNVVFSPLAQGVLTGKYAAGTIPPRTRAADPNTRGFVQRYLETDRLALADRVVRLAGECKVTPAQLALAWCLRRTEVSSVIVGVTSADQLADNVAASDLEIPEAVFNRIEE